MERSNTAEPSESVEAKEKGSKEDSDTADKQSELSRSVMDLLLATPSGDGSSISLDEIKKLAKLSQGSYEAPVVPCRPPARTKAAACFSAS